MSDTLPIIKFLFQTEWQPLSEAIELKTPYTSQSFNNANDLLTHLASAPAALIVSCLKDKNDLIQLATFIKSAKKAAPTTFFKVLVVNFSSDKAFEKAAGKLGILDLVEPRIATKALRFKLDFMMKSVVAQVKKTPAATGSDSVKSLDNGKNQQEAKKAIEKDPNWLDAMDCEDDIWILKNPNDCKKILTRWLIKFMGPSPYVASWIESGTAGIWKFEFKGGSEDFIFGKGAWYFRGDQKPEFVWNDNLWQFTGTSFELFYKNEDQLSPRVKLKDKSLQITKNSDYAKTKESKILESFDKDLVFKKGIISEEEASTLEKETDRLKNLSGKGKTDAINGGPLSGKSSTDALDGGPLSGKGNTDSLNGGPLSGKGSTSDLSSDPLGMDLKPGENNSSDKPLEQSADNGKQKSHWKGHNAHEQMGNGGLSAPVDNNVNPGAELSMENKTGHEKFYKNHNEAEQFAAKDIGHSIKKDGVADDLSGKTSTDQIDGHLRSPDPKGGTEKAAKKANEAEAQNKSILNREKPNFSRPSDDSETEDDFSAEDLDEDDGSGLSPDGTPKNKTQGAPRREKISRFYKSNKKPNATSGKDENESESAVPETLGKVLPFIQEKDVVSKDIQEAVQSAKVTAYLEQGSVNALCELDDFFDQTIIFTTTKSGLTSKTVKLNLNFNYKDKDTNLKFEANLLQVESDGEGSNYVTVEISPENVVEFNAFMKLYATRQENIEFFMKEAKGY